MTLKRLPRQQRGYADCLIVVPQKFLRGVLAHGGVLFALGKCFFLGEVIF